jgi:protein O-mannosyl-transferase
MGRKHNQRRTPHAADKTVVPPSPTRELRPPAGSRGQTLLACGLLLAAVVAVFGQTAWFDFINFDDDLYIYDNEWIGDAVPWQTTIDWAWTSRHASNWHPLTWLSHSVDCRLFGREIACGHHLMNVAIHAATAVLLLLVLRQMTGALWPSAFAAAVFALHPLRAESVAWVSERKDVLSGLMFVLTLAAYVHYVRRPFSLLRYLAVAAAFALGLMAKPMLVTLPLVLLLLDYWPLGRMRKKRTQLICRNGPEGAAHKLAASSFSPWRLLLEKLPLAALSAASCVVTFWAQSEALMINERITFPWRVANAAVAYVGYLGRFFYPARLAAMYPHPGANLSTWQIVAAVLALAAISAAAWLARRRAPFLLVGWLWYVVMLLPVIGLVQVGAQAMADRYTYLPTIGVAVAVVWTLAAAWPARLDRRWTLLAAGGPLAALAVAAWCQTAFWSDSEVLWSHALDCTTNNHIAQVNLGNEWLRQAEVLRRTDRGHEALARRLVDQAVECGRIALRIAPDNVTARNALTHFLAVQSHPGGTAGAGPEAQSLEEARRRCQEHPDSAEAHNNLGKALADTFRYEPAIAEYQTALRLNPDYVEALDNLGLAWANKKQFDAAIDCFRRALAIKPDDPRILTNLATTQINHRQLDEATENFQRAVAIDPDCAEAHGGLAAAYAKRSQFPQAAAECRKALDLAARQKKLVLVEVLQAHLRGYEAGGQPSQPP